MNRFYGLILTALFCGASPALAGVMSIQPSTFDTTVGQTFSLDVFISGAVDLYGYQFDIGFDPTILSAVSVTEGPFLASAGTTSFFPGFIDNAGGTISFIADSLTGAIAGASGDGTLATISFSALATGTSSVGIFNVEAFDSFGEDIPMTTGDGSVSVSAASAVPEPSPMILVLTALLLTGFLGRGRLFAHRR